MSLISRLGAWVAAAAVSAVATNASALIDGGIVDAGSFDAGDGAPDAGGGACDAGSGLACEQCDVSGFAPVELQAPIGPNAAMCTDNDISAFVTACGISTGTQAACSTWQSTTASTCVGCMLTKQTATQWGLAVCGATTCAYNSAGCIDLALGQTTEEKHAGGSGSCGDLVQAAFGCENYACSTCTVTTDFTACVQSAVAHECSSYATAQQSTSGACAAIDGSASESSCFPQTDTDIQAMATLFCGGLVAQPDAGSDGGNPVPDAGSKDAGATKDSGAKDATTDGPSDGDAGTSNFGKGGCHCDAAGATGTTDALMIAGLGAFVLVVASRRRKRA